MLVAGLFGGACLAFLLAGTPRDSNQTPKPLASAPVERNDFAMRWPYTPGDVTTGSVDSTQAAGTIQDLRKDGERKEDAVARLAGAMQARQMSQAVQVQGNPANPPNAAQPPDVWASAGSGAYAMQPRGADQQEPVREVKVVSNQHAVVVIPPTDNPLPAAKTELVPFASAPFPFESRPATSERFNDNRVLLHIPEGFDINKPAVMVVFFHGHRAELARDVLRRQQVPDQITLSGMNAVLVAPQFAVDAADSNPGRFAQPGAFGRFVAEAGEKLAQIYGSAKKRRQFDRLPVILVAYSGGYLPAARVIERGGIGKRLHGLVLLDALYGELNTYARWIKSSPRSFFVSAYTSSTRRQNLELARMLDEKNVSHSNRLENHLWHGGVALLSTDTVHRDFVTHAWTVNPIVDVLAKLK